MVASCVCSVAVCLFPARYVVLHVPMCACSAEFVFHHRLPPRDPTTLPFATEQLRTRSSFRSATPLCRPLMEYGSRSAEVHMQVRP